MATDSAERAVTGRKSTREIPVIEVIIVLDKLSRMPGGGPGHWNSVRKKKVSMWARLAFV
jgi:hypothetical protein